VISPAPPALLAAALLVLPGPGAVTSQRLAALFPKPAEAPPVARPVVLAGVLAGAVALTVAVAVAAAVSAGGPGGMLGGAVGGGALGVGVLLAARWIARTRAARSRDGPADPIGVAAGWDLLAACLHAGLPVPTAVRAVADGMPAPVAAVLHEVGELLVLGADPGDAWRPAMARPDTAPLARAARRSARSGAALAGVATELAAEIRAGAADEAEARAQRVGVLVAGPLGLCFLPAFLCLGVLPVVLGLAGHLLDLT
jgi:pilus assembly protein TadC